MDDELVKEEHIIVLATNLPYLCAAAFAAYFLPGRWKIASVPILLTFLTSIVNHLNVGNYEVKRWASILDRVTGSATGVFGIAVLFMMWGELDMCSALATLTTGLLAVMTFASSERKASSIIKEVDSGNKLPSRLVALDPVHGLNDLTDVGQSVRSQQVEYLSEHSLWHLLSGVAMLMWVVCVNYALK